MRSSKSHHLKNKAALGLDCLLQPAGHLKSCCIFAVDFITLTLLFFFDQRMTSSLSPQMEKAGTVLIIISSRFFYVKGAACSLKLDPTSLQLPELNS